MFRWYLANAALGNNDGHLKNLSVEHAFSDGRPQWRLAPVYDVLCTEIYPRYNQDFAVKVGKAWQALSTTGDDWRVFGQRLGLLAPEVSDEVALAPTWIAGMLNTALTHPELAKGAVSPLRERLLRRLERSMSWSEGLLGTLEPRRLPRR